jgi:superfamily II DNA/RNA helicase
LKSSASNRGIRTLAVYGGRAFEPQIEALHAGVEIVVGTPGRLLDLSRQGQLKLKEVSRLVLDEADEMLDLGFLPDVEKILSSTLTVHKLCCFQQQCLETSSHLPVAL